jgi:ABC-type cobalamin transport system ATPase subunit
MERIARLAHRDFTVILSSHDPNQVLLHATRALIVDKGSIRADGKPDDVMTPETLSDMFGVDVRRMHVENDGQVYSICIPVGLPQRG